MFENFSKCVLSAEFYHDGFIFRIPSGTYYVLKENEFVVEVLIDNDFVEDFEQLYLYERNKDVRLLDLLKETFLIRCEPVMYLDGVVNLLPGGTYLLLEENDFYCKVLISNEFEKIIEDNLKFERI